jgi:surfeit locus 1 family protein
VASPLLRGFRPRLWPTAIAATGVALLLALGTWQLFRLVEKRATNALRAERLAAPPAPLPAGLADPAAWEFRRVALRGRFDHAHELFLPCRSQRGNDGTCIVTPLLRTDGPPVLVNRGWVPPARKDPARRAAGQVAGEVGVEGVLRAAPQRSWAMPDNDPARNVWFWWELPAMARAAGLDRVAPFYVEASIDPAAPEGAPLGGQTRHQLPDNHLGYALTWYALAAALAAIYVISQRQPEES